MDHNTLRGDRDLVEKLISQSGGARAMSATYTPVVNGLLLALARDGLRFRLMSIDACNPGDDVSPEELAAMRDQRFLEEIDRRLAAL